MAGKPTPQTRGWNFNKRENRLDIVFNGTVVAHLNASGMSIVNLSAVTSLNGVAIPVDVDGPGTNGANILEALETLGLLNDIA